ncbi:MAG: DUF2231 domain-containing protein [Bacteroidetes bacterium]|nr:DUF2231 domain-containing protein [Bacteroidota bacterium]MCB0842153.1 DUF2231 domain-containing protein [Bacteroidota bacterium]
MPFHPQTVHFPIATLIVAGALYFYGWVKRSNAYTKAAFLLHIIGVGGLVLAVLSGRQANGEIVHTNNISSMIETHELIAYISTWLFSMLLIWQYLRQEKIKRIEEALFSILFIIFLGIMGYGSHIGGRMVYEEGAGVIPMKETLEKQAKVEQLNNQTQPQ